MREGDTVIVWKLDRLGCFLKELITLVSDFQEKRIGFRIINDTTLIILRYLDLSPKTSER